MPGLIEPDGLIVRERSVLTPGDGEAISPCGDSVLNSVRAPLDLPTSVLSEE